MLNLVLSGGGAKGIGHIGCLKALEEYNLINNIKNYGGNSIGTIFALLILIGYTYDELYKIILNFDMTQCMDIDILNFLENYSIYSNKKIKKILHIFVSKKFDDTNLTFEKLFNYTKKNLFIIAINIEDNIETIFSNKTTPNVLVYDAICASCAVPFILPPVRINNKLYIDGFIYNNYPCNLFKEDLDNTIGIQLNVLKPKNKIENIQDFIINILISSINTLSNISYTKPKLHILLNHNFNTFDILNASKKERENIINLCYNISKKYIEEYKSQNN